jgi:hypothetical protein
VLGLQARVTTVGSKLCLKVEMKIMPLSDMFSVNVEEILKTVLSGEGEGNIEI